MKLYRQAVRMDYMIKLFKYRTAGVREYWIVDSLKNRITVYNFEEDTMQDGTHFQKIYLQEYIKASLQLIYQIFRDKCRIYDLLRTYTVIKADVPEFFRLS